MEPKNQTSHQSVGLLLAFTHNPRERLTLAGTQHTKCHILQRRNGIFKQLFPLHPITCCRLETTPAKHSTQKRCTFIPCGIHSFIPCGTMHTTPHRLSQIPTSNREYPQHTAHATTPTYGHTALVLPALPTMTMDSATKWKGTNGEGFYRRPQPDFFPEEEFAAPGRECEADACNCWAWSSAISPSSSAGKLKPSYSVFFQ
jgi:hypothetical protein